MVPSLAPLVAATLLLTPGCAREAPETREVRLAAQRYLSALARKDLKQIRERATCVVPTHSIQGGNVLRIGAPRYMTLGGLDSLSEAAAAARQAADSAWNSADETARESLFRAGQRAAVAHVGYRNALRAVALSEPDSLHGSGTQVEIRAVHARIRYAGEWVGPKPVDRERVLGLIRPRSGRWIIYSFTAPEDDVSPGGV